MKQLILMRHSKAGQASKKPLEDHERPLTQKGVEACSFVADYCNHMHYTPDHILTSSALRAQDTAELVSRELNTKIPPEKNNKLYLCSAEYLYKHITLLDNTIQRLLIVGHNPGIQQFCLTLAGKGDKKKFREMRSAFPTRALAVFELNLKSWAEIKPQSGELKDFYVARTSNKP